MKQPAQAPIHAGIALACMLPLAFQAHGESPVMIGNPGILGSGIFIEPTGAHTNDTIVVSYPQRSCGPERVDIERNGSDIVILVSFERTCLGPFYRQVRIGQLPAGNYRIRLGYRDLSDGSDSYGTSELFSVMPAR